MIQKAILNISRVIFLSIISVFSCVFVYWEIITLSSISKNQTPPFVKDMAKQDTVGNVVIGESKENDKNNFGVVQTISADDARPLIIKNYLKKYNSPLLPYADLIYQLSNTYNYPYYWIVAIAQQESNLCKKIPENSNNCWGYGIHKRGTLRFDNYELALQSYAEYLKREYFDKGLNTPELIMKKYCPSSNGSWAKGVQQFIDEMESGKY
ncbi:MAG: hypothetical protein Q8P53_01370 [Candidatus Shapirobacteria bacterium]|nr:hypothetical protein [Candidatus Shapirobacteria bacterium]